LQGLPENVLLFIKEEKEYANDSNYNKGRD